MVDFSSFKVDLPEFGFGIPTSYRGVEEYSPMTPVTNYLSGIDNYIGLGAGNLFGGGGGYLGYLGGMPWVGPYGRFSYDSPLIMPFPISIPWLVPMGNDGNKVSPVNIADFINFSSPAPARDVNEEAAADSAAEAEVASNAAKKKPKKPKKPVRPSLKPGSNSRPTLKGPATLPAPPAVAAPSKAGNVPTLPPQDGGSFWDNKKPKKP